MKTDVELVAGARAGDRDALDTLLRRHYDRVNAICRRVLGSSRDADDAAQEAMISIVRGLGSFDGRAAFTTWLYRIATNAALDEVRKRNRRPALHVVEDRPDDADPVAHRQLDAVADRLAIDEAVADLPEDFRAAVVLRDLCDLDYAEIADVLGVPIGTVKSRIARGRHHLLQTLDAGNRIRPGERPTPAASNDEPAS